jgi:ABC-type nitrate/sulfonate/bicarbonate transport system substrate-binding protein
MRRTAVFAALVAALLALAGCKAATTVQPKTGSTGATPAASAAPQERMSKFVGKTEVFLHVTKVYDPAKFPKAAMDGEPSRIHFFKPVKDEGVINRDYPAYDGKTFKFLALPGAAMIFPPQSYYLFNKSGGSLVPALKGTGYKAALIRDSGHVKILPNLYVGYYDFAWISVNVLAEYWSGNESMNQELWRGGNDYVIVANSFNGGISLMAPPDVTSIKDLAGQKVGIMNPSFNFEAVLNKKLSTVGLATESAGGNVGVEMGSPGLIMNDLTANKVKAVFAWGAYAAQLKSTRGFRELVPWQELGYGDRMPYEVLVVRRDILAKHPDIVQKVVQANYDATKQALTVGDYKAPEYASSKYYWSHYFQSDRNFSDAELSRLMNLDADPNVVFLQDVYGYMSQHHYFRTPYRFDQLVDLSLANRVKR